MRRSLVVLVGIAVSGCQCGKEKLTWAGPHAEVTPPDTLEFGKVRFGSKVTRPITVFNDGRQELTVQVERPDGRRDSFPVVARLDSPVEINYYREGGILHTVLRKMLRGA